MIDFIIVIAYFTIILLVALRGKISADSSADEYFLSSRNLPWYSIALSTIATNIQGYQFLGMMGSAYLFGLAQANLEINAVQGILLGAFVFVPLFLKEKNNHHHPIYFKKIRETHSSFLLINQYGAFCNCNSRSCTFLGSLCR